MLTFPSFHGAATRSPRQSGFTLLEVLIAILILSFGMLGVVGLQAAAMQSNKEARNQSNAARFAREFAEMMRANQGVSILSTYAANPYLIKTDTPATTPSTTPAKYCVNITGSTAACTPTQQATFEVAEWWSRINGARDGLPGPRVVVCFDTAPYDTTTHKGNWTCTTPGTVGAGTPAYVKIGWTQQQTGVNSTANAIVSATAASAVPLVIFPVIN